MILIAVVVAAGLVVYSVTKGWMNILGPGLEIQIASVDLVKAEGKVLLSVAVKNIGNKPLAGIVASGFDDNGKRFSLALSPADPGNIKQHADHTFRCSKYCA